MGKEAALRQLEVVGQAADRQAFEPDPAGQLDGVVENRFAGGLALAHDPGIINERSC